MGRAGNPTKIIDEAQLVPSPGRIQLQSVWPLCTQRCTSQKGIGSILEFATNRGSRAGRICTYLCIKPPLTEAKLHRASSGHEAARWWARVNIRLLFGQPKIVSDALASALC